MRPWYLSIFILAPFVLSGCHPPTAFAPLDRPLVLSSDPNTLWRIAKKELTDRGFVIDRFDRRAEVIETFPLTSKQWFEFWRHDVVDDDSLTEASLQTIRRRITLTLATAPSRQTHLDCQVTVERLASYPDITMRVTRAKDIFAATEGNMPTLQSWADRKNYDQHWIPLGRDKPLEIAVLRQIEKTSQKELDRIRHLSF